jgi:hypothetical protein
MKIYFSQKKKITSSMTHLNDSQVINMTTTTTTAANEYGDLLKDIFNMNDGDQNGYITIESFLTIIKENWPMSLDESVSVWWFYFRKEFNLFLFFLESKNFS